MPHNLKLRLWGKTLPLSSEWYLTQASKMRPDLVPAPGNVKDYHTLLIIPLGQIHHHHLCHDLQLLPLILLSVHCYTYTECLSVRPLPQTAMSFS